MQFSTRQVQELANVRREQLRHWKKVLPPLSGRDGRAETYSFSDVLAISIIVTIVDELGIPVSRLIAASTDLFALIAESDAQAVSTMRLHIDPKGSIVTNQPSGARIFAVIDVGKVFQDLRARLGPDQLRQLSLPFE